jgi:hypothetical protein
MESKMKSFVSYTIRDGLIDINILRVIYDKLSNDGEVYIDLLHNKSKFPQLYVMKKLITSNCFIVIKTPKVTESPWCRLEMFLACILRIERKEVDLRELLCE